MATVTVSEEKLKRVLADVEVLIEDVVSLVDQDEIVKRRMKDIESDPSIGVSEQELDQYLKKRGVNIA